MRKESFNARFEESQKVVDATIKLINLYTNYKATPCNRIPTKDELHPPDIYIEGLESLPIPFEIKRDCKSRKTGNIFFEKKALGECKGMRLILWIDGLGTFFYCEIDSLLRWLEEEDVGWRKESGDSKFSSYFSNPGWVIPIWYLIKNIPPTGFIGPIMNCGNNLPNYFGRGEEWREVGKGSLSNCVRDFGIEFWNDSDKEWKRIKDNKI